MSDREKILKSWYQSRAKSYLDFLIIPLIKDQKPMIKVTPTEDNSNSSVKN